MQRLDGKKPRPSPAHDFQKKETDLTSLSRRIELGFVSLLCIYEGDIGKLLVETIREFGDKKVIRLDADRIIKDYKIRNIHKDGSDDLRSIIIQNLTSSNLVVLHGYDERLLQHFSVLFDDLGRSDYKLSETKPGKRDVKTLEKLEMTGSFLMIVWTADQKQQYLDKWPGSASTREFTFVQESLSIG